MIETVDQALSAIDRQHVASVQIILNAFRRKPLEQVLPAAAARFGRRARLLRARARRDGAVLQAVETQLFPTLSG